VEKDPDVLTVDEAAALLGVHVRSVYASLKLGRLPGRKVGRSWRLHRGAILEWLGTVEDADWLVSGGADDEDQGESGEET
jgi:excisionase family DNA binding protein